MFIALIGIIGDRNYYKDRSNAQDATTNCRAALAANVTSAQVESDLAEGRLVTAIAAGGNRLQAVADLNATADHLKAARDLRVDFEKDPKVTKERPCPR